MKKLILILFLPIVLNAQILTLFVNDSPLTYADTAKTYYVDGVGTGDTLATIAEVNALTLNPADQVLFKRGVTWRERLIVHNSGVVNYPIVIGAYGTGADPIIDGQSTLSSSLTWVDKGNSVFGAYTNYGLSTVFNVTEDGIPLSNMVDGYTGSATNISGNGQWTYNDASDTVFVRTNNGVNPSSVDIAMTRFQATIHLGYSWATKVDYVTVENLDIRGSYYNITIYGKGVTIQNCDLKGTYSACVKIYADYPADPDNPVHITKAQDILVYNNDMQTFGENGVDNTGGEDVTIQGNTIHNSVANRGYADSGTKANGIMTKNYAVNTVIEYNKIYDMERARFGAIMVGGQTSTGWDKESVNVTVKYNLIYNITNLADGSAPSYIIVLMAAHDAKIYNNTITNCVVQGIGAGSGLINFDLSNDNNPNYNVENPVIMNNIFYDNNIQTGYLIAESTNGDVENLIVSNNIYDSVFQAKYLGVIYSSFDDWELKMEDTNSILNDPILNADFSISEGSPTIDAGTDVGLIKDILGNPIIDKPDIGAYEYQGTVISGVYIEPVVYLSGSFQDTDMVNALRTNNLLPKIQPYNIAPWRYNGSESVNNLPVDMVDWVLLDLRRDSSTIASRRAALLLRNGKIVDIDGISPVYFNDVSKGNYYLVIHHRNHLAVMSRNKIGLSSNPVVYNFTNSESKAYGNNAMEDLGNSKFGMYAGDGDSNGKINTLDYGTVANKVFSNGYLRGDIEMNGTVNVLDYKKIYQNILKSTNVPSVKN